MKLFRIDPEEMKGLALSLSQGLRGFESAVGEAGAKNGPLTGV